MNFNLLQERALAKGFKSIEIYQVKKSGADIKVFNKEVQSSTTYETNVCAVRGVYKKKVGLFYTENLVDDSNIDAILDAIIVNTSVINTKEPSFFYKGDKKYKELEVVKSNFHEFSMKQKTDLCFEVENAVLTKHKTVTSSNVSYSESTTSVTIKNSNGLNLTREDSYATLFADAVCRNSKDVKNGYDYQVVFDFNEFNPAKLAKGAVDLTVKSLNATSIESNKYKVILDASAASNLLQVFSNNFSAAALLKKTTFLADELGNKVFGDNITIVDDPLFKKALSKSTFDDEGVKASKTTLVENGVFKNFMHNLKTAKMLKAKSTSNGFKPSVAAAVSVMPSNLYLKPGKNKVKDLYASCQNGVLIRSLAGLHSGV
ncbi:MAG: TldD/PmbA family protein, partial [bacterium]